MLNICPINIMPFNVTFAEIKEIIKKTIEQLKELKNHLKKKYACVDKIFEYIKRKDINMIISQMDKSDDPIIIDALVKLNAVLQHSYELISEYKVKYHIRCIDYASIIENIDVAMNILNIRIELHKYNKLNEYCLNKSDQGTK